MQTASACQIRALLRAFRALIRPDGADSRVLDLTVHVSDRDPGTPAGLDGAQRDVAAAVQTELGEPVRTDAWEHARTVWDIASGGRVVVRRLESVVIVLRSQEVADLERGEERLGDRLRPHPGYGTRGPVNIALHSRDARARGPRRLPRSHAAFASSRRDRSGRGP